MRARGGGVRGTSRSARCCFSGSACMRQTLTARCCPVFRSSAAYTLRSTRRMSCSPSPIRRQHGWVARHLLSRDAEADAPEQPQRGGAAGDHLLPNQRVRAAALHLRIGGLQRSLPVPSPRAFSQDRPQLVAALPLSRVAQLHLGGGDTIQATVPRAAWQVRRMCCFLAATRVLCSLLISMAAGSRS